MKHRISLFLLAIGLCTPLFAESKRELPQISFVGPSSSPKPVSRDKLVILVVEGPFMTHEKTPVSSDGVVAYVNGLLGAKGVSNIGVYIREGIKYGDVVRSLDVLSQTTAKSIGVSMLELPVGREP